MGKVNYFENGGRYVPVIRWKRAERLALQAIPNDLKSSIHPLIEFIPEDFLKIEKGEILKKVLEKRGEISKSWGHNTFFLDFSHITELLFNKHSLQIEDIFIEGMASTKLTPILVIHPGYSSRTLSVYAQLVKELRIPCAIRIPKSWFSIPTLKDTLEKILATLGIESEKTRLILDYQIWEANQLSVEIVLNNISQNSKWLDLTALCGAFPKDLTQFSVGQHELNRSDFHFWRDQNRDVKKLNFGDYTTQHAVYNPPPARANFSASIRYASHNYWVIMRGESVFKDDGPGFDQWPANAQLLCERNEYCGSVFSAGDKYIGEMSTSMDKTGNAGTWLQAGINHHITFVVQQLASLGAP